MDEEFVLYRAEHSSERGLPSVLVLAPASKHPPLATLKKIEHEYSLRHELELDAQAALLQSQLDYVQAADEMDAAIGRRPR
jgi:hypothetical protein